MESVSSYKNKGEFGQIDYDTERCKIKMRHITTLFQHVYAENILSHLEEQEGIGERNLNNLRYADDTTLLADSESKLQRLVDVVVQKSCLLYTSDAADE